MSEITKSIQLLCDAKGLEYDIVMEAVESALGAAYRKDFGHRQMNIEVKFDPETGDMEMWDVKEVVEDIAEDALEAAQEELAQRREAAIAEGRELTDEEVEDLPRFNPKLEMMLAEAKTHKKDVSVGDTIRIGLPIPGDFGRMAAQTAKQVIIQKIREAERSNVFEDFKDQEGQIIQAIVQRRDRSGKILIDLGKITGVVPQEEQVSRDRYRPGVRMKFYVLSVSMGNRGPEIILSRSHIDMVRAIFEQEIPEIDEGSVIIKGIAREAGNRSKVAVYTDDESIDPIGACIGQRGSRITTIIDELGGEKIDMIQYSDKAEQYIREALSPAKVESVELNEEENKAAVTVPADQFSLAIGRGGQNVRLASQLTGWEIDVLEGEKSEEEAVEGEEEPTEDAEEEVSADVVSADEASGEDAAVEADEGKEDAAE